MQLFTSRTYPLIYKSILKDTLLIITENFDASVVESTIIDILPEDLSMLGTKVSLQIVQVLQDENHQAYYSMLFEKPADYPDDQIQSIYKNCQELDDSFKHNLQRYSDTLYQITFKVG